MSNFIQVYHYKFAFCTSVLLSTNFLKALSTFKALLAKTSTNRDQVEHSNKFLDIYGLNLIVCHCQIRKLCSFLVCEDLFKCPVSLSKFSVRCNFDRNYPSQTIRHCNFKNRNLLIFCNMASFKIIFWRQTKQTHFGHDYASPNCSRLHKLT